MERDFMGLNSKEKAIEAVLLKSSTVQWSLSNGPEDLNYPQLKEHQKNIDPHHGHSQLTIFYKGTVNVFDHMSPKKAQAIMLLAGNGARAQAQAQARAEAQAATPRTIVAGQPMNTALLSPVSVGAPMTRDAPKVMSSLRRVMQSDVPQMREASLARFLEKRKERITSKPGSSSGPSKEDHK